MNRQRIKPRQKLGRLLCIWALLISTVLTGCQPMQPYYLHEDGDLSHYLDVATEIEYTDVCVEPLQETSESYAPRTISDPGSYEKWHLTLEDAVSIALHNTKVIRTFGQVRQFGQIVGGPPERLSVAPDSVGTIFDTAIQETGQSGVQQALSNFDAIFSSSTTWDSTDREQNFSMLVQSQARQFQQDQVQINNEISKLSATGTQTFIRNIMTYTGANNQQARNVFAVPSDWLVSFEAEVRQPLLRNRGTQVNRLPLVLARIRTDQTLIQFQGNVRDLLSNVERAYWELYFFYHNLQAAKTGRDSAQAAWQKVQALFDEGADGGEAEKVAQAQEQYFFFRGRVEDAQRDLFKSETRLRYLMGLAPTDERLILPADSPTTARIEFEWNLVREEAMIRNGELRTQGWRIRAQEMQLIAARNQLLPQLDIVALYRWLGNGDNFNSDTLPAGPIMTGFPASAVGDLFSGDKQEFRLGFQFNMPLGFRRELSQVRSSQLSLARERAKFQDMQLEVVHQLTDAIQSLDAGYRSLRTGFNRRAAAENHVRAVEAAYLAGTVQLDLLLDAQRRQADANISYFQVLLEYNNTIMMMHYRKGSLMEYNGVMLSEGPWPKKAYFDAVNQARRRDSSHYLDYGYSRPHVISRGAVSSRWETVKAGHTESVVDGSQIVDGRYAEELDKTIDTLLDGSDIHGETINAPTEDVPVDRGVPTPNPSSDRPRVLAPETLPEPGSPPSPSNGPFRIEPEPTLEDALEAGRRLRTVSHSPKAIDIQWRD